jgi:hypothetical protein
MTEILVIEKFRDTNNLKKNSEQFQKFIEQAKSIHM